MSECSKVLSAIVAFAAAAAQAQCFVSAGGMGFGAYDVSDGYPRDSELVMTLTCRDVIAHDVSVSIGSSATSGAIQSRQMKWSGGNDRLDYNLFVNQSRTQVWGDASTGGSVLVKGITRDIPQNVRVYGRIGAGQDRPAGDYVDTITITLDVVK